MDTLVSWQNTVDISETQRTCPVDGSLRWLVNILYNILKGRHHDSQGVRRRARSLRIGCEGVANDGSGYCRTLLSLNKVRAGNLCLDYWPGDGRREIILHYNHHHRAHIPPNYDMGACIWKERKKAGGEYRRGGHGEYQLSLTENQI